MFKERSIQYQLFGFFFLGLFLLLGVAGFGVRVTYEGEIFLGRLQKEVFNSVTMLQQIEDIAEGVMRLSLHRYFLGTLGDQETIDIIDAAHSEITVRLKSYLDQERSRDGNRNFLNQSIANAIDGLNISWLALKGIIRSKGEKEGKKYLMEEFYPKLDHLGRTYSQLLNRWMDDLEDKRSAFLLEMLFDRRNIFLATTTSLSLFSLFFYLLRKRLQHSIAYLTKNLKGLRDHCDDFTRRIASLRNEEINAPIKGVNDYLQLLKGRISRVKRSGVEVTTCIPKIVHCSDELSHKISEFRSFTGRVGSTAKEISATSHELVKLMTDVSATATKTAELATSGQSGLVGLEGTMTQMEEASRQISKKLAVISEKAANITMVVTTINKFADQTNLLSLNASIEAEKAGEYGLGFAVVAREIRRLADQVALATLDIEQMVKEMKSAVSSGVMEMDKFTEEVRCDVRDVRNVSGQLAQIIKYVQTLIPCFESVHGAVQTQASGAQQIYDSMVQLSEAVEQASASIARISPDLFRAKNAAKELESMVQAFIVDGKEEKEEEEESWNPV